MVLGERRIVNYYSRKKALNVSKLSVAGEGTNSPLGNNKTALKRNYYVIK